MNYAIVNDATHVVENVVLWDGESEWVPPEGSTPVADPDKQARIGGTYQDGHFVPPENPP